MKRKDRVFAGTFKTGKFTGISQYVVMDSGSWMKCVISCEHAANRVPPRYRHVFRGEEKILASHRAYDPGAAALARRFGRQLHAPVHLGTISRLLIDLNRSLTNRKSLYTEYSGRLASAARQELQEKYYRPYRKKVEETIAAAINRGEPVLHMSIHSFAPVKNGKIRKADIGLLYDPARGFEKDLCGLLAGLLQDKVPSVRVRRNYPYLGRSDGFTSLLRRQYAAPLYAGIEIEVNQAFLLKNDTDARKTFDVMAAGIRHMAAAEAFQPAADMKSGRIL